MEYNYSTLHDLGVLNRDLSFQEANQLLKENIKNNN